MRIDCPYCGARDLREYTYGGAAAYLQRPEAEAEAAADDAAWDAYLHLRDNPAGRTRDLWFHEPCATWLEVERDTVSHEIFATRALAGVRT
ncbi:sarcosine oxidase subunit delta [Pararhodobacter oceanensis]|uniref:Sarcosine oxidase subunit delta n=1 Tax=Pararhodobacter oceanensis TaxID=2172121 RepID=A0A2T8HT80_9RHOB|nr:sarcosine oxidase subunit delta [Pararhodobacter oceanensis]PVH28626.1 sarcosine oxidase subunit delta [Pararhodobacter oceanensis]